MKLLKLSVLAAMGIASAISASATTNLLQSVSVSFTVFSQGPTVGTTYNVDKTSFGTKSLISALSSNGYKSGDILARSTPVVYTSVTNTNLVTVTTVALVVTNESTSELAISNYLILGSASPVFIGATNYTFGTNTETINGQTVTISNSVTAGGTSLVIGTNTTVVTTALTNSVGNVVGSSNLFTINALTNSLGVATNLGTASWVIYNKKSTPETTPILTNVSFNIYTDHVYDATNVSAIIHGQTISKIGVIQRGTTDEIRSFVLSNASWNIKLNGYSSGHYVPLNLGSAAHPDDVYSADYNWVGSGSGLSNSAPVVIEGAISEQYFDLLK